MASTCERSNRYRARVFRLVSWFFVGAGTTLVVTTILALSLAVPGGVSRSANALTADGYWQVTRWSRPGAVYIDSHRRHHAQGNWAPEQVLGPPDTPRPGDTPSAWASKSQDNQIEWLLLDYATPVVPAEIHVYETWNPGALFKASVFDSSDREVVVWQGEDPTPVDARMGVSKLPVDTDLRTCRVKLYLDSPAVRGWNEIDAVALVGADGRVQWATAVRASSTYASQTPAGGPPEKLIPSWCTLKTPMRDFHANRKAEERRVACGFGWPFIAMVCEFEPPPGPVFVVSGTTPTTQRLPNRPLLTWFALDAALYALVLWLTSQAFHRPRRAWRELFRMRRGCCIRCGYDLRYEFGRGCPECGWNRDGTD